MLYGKFIDELLNRVKAQDLTNVEARAIAGGKINAAYKEIGNNTNVNWKQLERYGEVVTVPNYVTGTCTITNGSRSVSFSGASLTSSMEGRFFQPLGSSNWYRIQRVVSSSELTLLSPIIEASASGLTFIIWKRWYYLPSEVNKVLDLGSWIRNGKITEKSLNNIQDFNNNISNTGEPIEFSMFGVDIYENEYSDGSVSLTQDNSLMSGTGTSWLENVTPGDIVKAGTQVLRVKRVEADDRIRLLNRAPATISPESYSIMADDRIGFQLWWNPNSSYLIPFYYSKYVYDMVNETYDRPELPEKFDLAILDLAEASLLSDKNDSKWVTKQNLARDRIGDLKTNRYVSQPKSRQMRPLIENNRGRYINGY